MNLWTMERLMEIVDNNPRQAVREITQQMNLSHPTITRHSANIGEVKKMDKWVPCGLSNGQKLK